MLACERKEASYRRLRRLENDMANKSVIPFLFEGEVTVRVIDRAGAPWFVAADVCRAVGIKQAGRAVSALDDDEKGVISIHTLGGRPLHAAHPLASGHHAGQLGSPVPPLGHGRGFAGNAAHGASGRCSAS